MHIWDTYTYNSHFVQTHTHEMCGTLLLKAVYLMVQTELHGLWESWSDERHTQECEGRGETGSANRLRNSRKTKMERGKKGRESSKAL